MRPNKLKLAGFSLGVLLAGTPFLCSAQTSAAPAAAPIAAPAAPAAAGAQPAALPTDQLRELLKPIALYPDPLVAQILPASTYPLDIVAAARWVQANPAAAKDDAQINAQTWDPSVKALCHFPDVLKMMNDKLDWTQALGAAFMASSDAVLNAVQDLRTMAKDAGTLKDSQQMKVVSDNNTIQIQPADPQIVYVPQYNPQTVYVPQYVPAPSTSVVYSDPNYYNNTGAAVAAGALTFAAGVAVGSWANNDVDWHHGNVYVNPHNNGWNSWGNDVRINTGDININNIDRDRNDFYRNIDNNNTLDNLQKSQIKDSFGKLNPNDQATQLAKYNKMTPEQRQQSTSNLKNMPGAGGSGTQWQRNPTKPAPPPTATSSQLANYRGQTAAASGATAANFGGRVGGAGAQNLTQPRPSSAQVQQQLASRPATANAQVPSNANFQNRPQTAGQVGGQAAAARPAAQNYERPSAPSTSALSGYGSAAQTQQASNRGQQSLGSSSMNRPQSMPSQNMSRPSAQSQSRPAPNVSRPSAPSRPSGGGGGGGGRRR